MNKYFVFDTNVLISALLNFDGNEAKAFLKARKIGTLLASEEILTEYLDVLARKKFDKYVSLAVRLEFFDIISEVAIMIVPTTKIDICRDKKDNMILELAIDAKADAIISSDKDLLILNPFNGIPIINSAQFLKWN
ncbi:MAG: putative toxin-antitoxin system toxin component, PIN family [Bacteroidetes bacterium]|nr:MAG: putative toxin-antitoxin system toxin component, PIN family [Bacteroidota bacterium]